MRAKQLCVKDKGTHPPRKQISQAEVVDFVLVACICSGPDVGGTDHTVALASHHSLLGDTKHQFDSLFVMMLCFPSNFKEL